MSHGPYFAFPALVERVSDGVQTRDAVRLQLSHDGSQPCRTCVGTRHTGFFGVVQGAVAHVATGRHHCIMPMPR